MSSRFPSGVFFLLERNRKKREEGKKFTGALETADREGWGESFEYSTREQLENLYCNHSLGEVFDKNLSRNVGVLAMRCESRSSGFLSTDHKGKIVIFFYKKKGRATTTRVILLSQDIRNYVQIDMLSRLAALSHWNNKSYLIWFKRFIVSGRSECRVSLGQWLICSTEMWTKWLDEAVWLSLLGLFLKCKSMRSRKGQGPCRTSHVDLWQLSEFQVSLFICLFFQ